MRILVAADFYSPLGGGAELHTQRTIRGLVARGHDVEVVTLSVPGEPAHTLVDGVDVHRVTGLRTHTARFAEDPRRVFSLPIHDPVLRREVVAHIERFRPDVIHGHGPFSLAFVGGQIDPPVVVTHHDVGAACVRRTGLHRSGTACRTPGPLRCALCAPAQYGPIGAPIALASRSQLSRWRRVAHHIAVSEWVAGAIRPLVDRPDAMVTTIPNFVETSRLIERSTTPLPPPLEVALPANGFGLFIGATNAFKGIPLVVESWRPGDPELVVAGPLVEPLAGRPLPPGVIALGSVDPTVIPALIARAGAVVVPSVGPDSCPGVILEAFALGVPVVGTQMGGIPELVDDRTNGRIVPASDGRAVLDALAWVLDPVRHAPLSDAALGASSRFDIDAVLDRVEATLDDVSAGSHRAMVAS